MGAFSATGYFFGKVIHQQLDVPVGLIRSAWGGTCVEAWSPMHSLEKFPSVMAYKAGMDKQAEGFDEAAVEKRYQTQVEAWK